MIKDLLTKLRKKETKPNTIDTKQEEVIKEKSNDVNINISQQNNFYKIEISDYISLHDYTEKIRNNDNYEILKSNPLLWNDEKQKVNKGTFYITNVMNSSYTILLTDGQIMINEMSKKELDQNEIDFINDNLDGNHEDLDTYFIQDRNLVIYLDSNNYRYSLLKHTEMKNTYYVGYYSKLKKFAFEQLTDEEMYDEINSLLSNLQEINGINDILDLDLLNMILDDVKEKIPNKGLR